MFEIKNGMSPAIVSDIFLTGTEIITTLYNKMTFLTFYTNGITWQTLSYVNANIWNSISTEFELEYSLRTFKTLIKLWTPLKTYINGIGFL